jgi:hypothetical protein
MCHSKTHFKVPYITQCVLLKVIRNFLYIALHVSTGISHHQGFKIVGGHYCASAFVVVIFDV